MINFVYALRRDFYLVAVWLAACSLCPDAGAEHIFFVEGKQVKASTYQAIGFMNEAISLLRVNKTVAAIAKLRRSILIDPQIAEAHSVLGLALARIGKTDDAIEQFRIALAIDGGLMNARANLAGLYQSSGQLQDALDVYKQMLATETNPKFVSAAKERVKLVSGELAREKDAQQASVDDCGTYFSNVTASGRKRWSGKAMPLKLFIVPGDALDTYRPEYETVLKQCFAEWQKVSAGKVRFSYVKDRSQADIVCSWVDDPNKLESSAEGGEANVKTLSNGIIKSDILLSLKDEGAFPLTNNLIRVLALHEIGHSLGLMGHSAAPKDVLFCTLPIVDSERHLTPRDVNTLAALYSQELDPYSELLTKLDRDTHGNAVNAIRTAIVALTVLICILIGFTILVKKMLPAKARKRKS